MAVLFEGFFSTDAEVCTGYVRNSLTEATTEKLSFSGHTLGFGPENQKLAASCTV